MKKQIHIKTPRACWYVLACIIFLLSNHPTFAQGSQSYELSRDVLVKTLKKKEIDPGWSKSIDQFYFKSADSLIARNITVEGKPIKELLLRLFVASQSKIDNRSISILRIPSVNNYFLQTIEKYKKQPLRDLYREIGIAQSSILESTFIGPLGDSIALIMGIREMLNNPYFITTLVLP